jgi:hypothetical protein
VINVPPHDVVCEGTSPPCCDEEQEEQQVNKAKVDEEGIEITGGLGGEDDKIRATSVNQTSVPTVITTWSSKKVVHAGDFTIEASRNEVRSSLRQLLSVLKSCFA